jgi:hypothetical protein
LIKTKIYNIALINKVRENQENKTIQYKNEKKKKNQHEKIKRID